VFKFVMSERTWKAILWLSAESIFIWWNPEAKSQKNIALPNWSRMSTILDNEYSSPTVFSFRTRKSNTVLHFLFPFESSFSGLSIYGHIVRRLRRLYYASFEQFFDLLIYFLFMKLWKSVVCFTGRLSVADIWCCNTLVAIFLQEYEICPGYKIFLFLFI